MSEREPRAKASLAELKACMQWLSACSELGWSDDSLQALEELWWKYHPPGKPSKV